MFPTDVTSTNGSLYKECKTLYETMDLTQTLPEDLRKRARAGLEHPSEWLRAQPSSRVLNFILSAQDTQQTSRG